MCVRCFMHSAVQGGGARERVEGDQQDMDRVELGSAVVEKKGRR